MKIRCGILLALAVVWATNVKAQIADLSVHHQVKDSIIARFNRNNFAPIYQLADTSYHSTQQQLTKFLTNYKRNFGLIIKSTFLADSVCPGCTSKRGKYYVLDF